MDGSAIVLIVKISAITRLRLPAKVISRSLLSGVFHSSAQRCSHPDIKGKKKSSSRNAVIVTRNGRVCERGFFLKSHPGGSCVEILLNPPPEQTLS